MSILDSDDDADMERSLEERRIELERRNFTAGKGFFRIILCPSGLTCPNKTAFLLNAGQIAGYDVRWLGLGYGKVTGRHKYF